MKGGLRKGQLKSMKFASNSFKILTFPKWRSGFEKIKIWELVKDPRADLSVCGVLRCGVEPIFLPVARGARAPPADLSA
jgi:hypothetical protein